jgi:hypothetical protein
MKRAFVETIEFTQWAKAYLSDESLAELQRELLKDPGLGSVMTGCGGLRKMRFADARRKKGKRGGLRVIYLHVAEAEVIFLMDIYDKNDQVDLTAEQKKILKRLAESYKSAAIRAKAFGRERR